ncbi:glycosyltransferase [Synechocystis sp. PCC 7509]|uniref:glycosyltransferase n=1 Tax=Synechocystis sp. PCC 7509 TaxID=927677 RepID=UPI0002ABDFCA|nr:glycosyltransferase [Synechocystis sp. PCC 7509]
MRVAFVVASFPVLSETFILNQIVGLIDRGFTIDIYAIQENVELETTNVHPNVEKYHLLERTYYVPKIPKNFLLRLLKGITLLPNFSQNLLVALRSLNIFKYGTQALSLRLLYRAKSLVGKEPYDIIHCQFGTLALPIMVLRELGAIEGRLVTSFRGYDITEFIYKEGENIYRQLFPTGDFFLPNCNYFKNILLKLGCDQNKLAVLESGIDCSKFAYTPRIPVDGFVRLVTTGRLVEKKGIEYCIRAVAKLAKSHKKIEYNIIGDGVLRSSLQQLIDELAVNEQVKILGWKRQPEVVEILNRSSIFIATSVTASDGNQEGIPNTLKEAMAMGMPVIGTLHAGIPELIEDGVSGFLVPEKDVDALVEKLALLIENPLNWVTMGQAGRAYVEKHYDTNKLNDRSIEIYQQVMKGKAEQKLG